VPAEGAAHFCVPAHQAGTHLQMCAMQLKLMLDSSGKLSALISRQAAHRHASDVAMCCTSGALLAPGDASSARRFFPHLNISQTVMKQ
jgi:hypothetical protein